MFSTINPAVNKSLILKMTKTELINFGNSLKFDLLEFSDLQKDYNLRLSKLELLRYSRKIYKRRFVKK